MKKINLTVDVIPSAYNKPRQLVIHDEENALDYVIPVAGGSHQQLKQDIDYTIMQTGIYEGYKLSDVPDLYLIEFLKQNREYKFGLAYSAISIEIETRIRDNVNVDVFSPSKIQKVDYKRLQKENYSAFNQAEEYKDSWTRTEFLRKEKHEEKKSSPSSKKTISEFLNDENCVAELKQRITYEPLTGKFIRLSSSHHRSKSGAEVLTKFGSIKLLKLEFNPAKLAIFFIDGFYPTQRFIEFKDGDRTNYKFDNLIYEKPDKID